jgi:hypothetical protein
MDVPMPHGMLIYIPLNGIAGSFDRSISILRKLHTDFHIG